MLNAEAPAVVSEDLRAIPRVLLIARIALLEGRLRAQAQTVEEIVNERDAARLLNELCHY